MDLVVLAFSDFINISAMYIGANALKKLINTNSYELIDPFGHGKPVNFPKVFVSDTLSVAKEKTEANTLILSNLKFIFNNLCQIGISCTACIIKVWLD